MKKLSRMLRGGNAKSASVVFRFSTGEGDRVRDKRSSINNTTLDKEHVTASTSTGIGAVLPGGVSAENDWIVSRAINGSKELGEGRVSKIGVVA